MQIKFADGIYISVETTKVYSLEIYLYIIYCIKI